MMVRDDFSGRSAGLNAPAQRLVPVTPNDAAELPNGLTRGLFVGGAGSVEVEDAYGNVAALVSGDGQYHPVRVIRVRALNTTATGIVALY